MRTRTDHTGFSVVELLIVLVVIAVIGFIGYSVYNRQSDKTATNGNPTTQTSNSQLPTAHVSTAPAVNSASDLDNELTILNQNDPATANNSDNSQLSSQTNF